MSLLIKHQRFTESIEPGVSHFDHPAPRRMALLCAMLFNTRTDMGNVAAASNRLLGGSTTKTSVGAQMLSCVAFDARPPSHDGIEHGFELRDVMMVGRGDDDR